MSGLLPFNRSVAKNSISKDKEKPFDLNRTIIGYRILKRLLICDGVSVYFTFYYFSGAKLSCRSILKLNHLRI